MHPVLKYAVSSLKKGILKPKFDSVKVSSLLWMPIISVSTFHLLKFKHCWASHFGRCSTASSATSLGWCLLSTSLVSRRLWKTNFLHWLLEKEANWFFGVAVVLTCSFSSFVWHIYIQGAQTDGNVHQVHMLIFTGIKWNEIAFQKQGQCTIWVFSQENSQQCIMLILILRS